MTKSPVKICEPCEKLTGNENCGQNSTQTPVKKSSRSRWARYIWIFWSTKYAWFVIILITTLWSIVRSFGWSNPYFIVGYIPYLFQKKIPFNSLKQEGDLLPNASISFQFDKRRKYDGFSTILAYGIGTSSSRESPTI